MKSRLASQGWVLGVFGIFASLGITPASANQRCLQSIRYSIMTGEALRLCQGSYDAGPADCFNAAYRSQLPLGIAVGLCISAADTTPFDCYKEAARTIRGLNVHTAALLCAKARNLEPISCYRNGRYSTVGTAVYYCKQNGYGLNDDPFTWAKLRF